MPALGRHLAAVAGAGCGARLRGASFFLSHFRDDTYDVAARGHLAERGALGMRVMPEVSGWGFGGTLVNWLFALPIALAIVLVLVHLLGAGEVATFLDQLTISGIVAFGIVKAFFA